MKRRAAVAAAALLVFGCGRTDQRGRPCPPLNDESYFFVQDTFSPTPAVDTLVRGWFSKHLAAAGERSLSCAMPALGGTYRFTWLRTFHAPVVVSATWSGDAGELRATVLGGRGGYEPGQVARTVQRPLAVAEWATLERVITDAQFWSPSLSLHDERPMLDGAMWVFEGRRTGQYRVLYRHTPCDGPYRALGLQFLDLAGLRPPKDEIY